MYMQYPNDSGHKQGGPTGQWLYHVAGKSREYTGERVDIDERGKGH